MARKGVDHDVNFMIDAKGRGAARGRGGPGYLARRRCSAPPPGRRRPSQPRRAAAGPRSGRPPPPDTAAAPRAAPNSRRSARISASSTAIAVPLVSASASRISSSPSGAGTLMPKATVDASGPRLARRSPGVEGPHDRGAAGRLHRDQPRQRPVRDPAQLAQLQQRLVDADQADPAAGRVDDDVGQPPAELLDDLQAHRLLALEPVRLLERGRVEDVAVRRRPRARRSARRRRR